MEQKGLLASSWGRSELDRRAKFYELTPKGRARLSEEVEAWTTFSQAVSLILTG